MGASCGLNLKAHTADWSGQAGNSIPGIRKASKERNLKGGQNKDTTEGDLVWPVLMRGGDSLRSTSW